MDYDNQKYKLHNLYLQQLDKAMKQYPAYKVGQPNTYTTELSLLNGITKQIDDLHETIKEDLSSISRMIQGSDTAISQIETIETNLSNYTTAEALDVTSRQMLADAIEEYNEQKILFFIIRSHFLQKHNFLLVDMNTLRYDRHRCHLLVQLMARICMRLHMVVGRPPSAGYRYVPNDLP